MYIHCICIYCICRYSDKLRKLNIHVELLHEHSHWVIQCYLCLLFIIIKSPVKVHWICTFFKIMNCRQYGSLLVWKVYHQEKFMGYILIGYFIFMRFKNQYTNPTWILWLLCVLLMGSCFYLTFKFMMIFIFHGLISFSNINFFMV